MNIAIHTALTVSRFKVHVVATADGIPVEDTFTAGSIHDMNGLRQMPLNFSESSEIIADSADTDYDTEEMFTDNGTRLWVDRKSNTKHPHSLYREYLIS